MDKTAFDGVGFAKLPKFRSLDKLGFHSIEYAPFISTGQVNRAGCRHANVLGLVLQKFQPLRLEVLQHSLGHTKGNGFPMLTKHTDAEDE